MGTVRIEKDPTWYLWAVNDDPDTNEYLAKVIGEQNPECERRDVACADGKTRNLWRSPSGYDVVLRAKSAVLRFGLKLEVFQENSEGVVRRYDLWKASVRKKALHTQHLRAVAKRGHKRRLVNQAA